MYARKSNALRGAVIHFCLSFRQELLYEDETRIRLLGGFYHGSGTRHQRSLSLRNRSRGSDGFPQSMQLISAGDPVPHAVSTPATSTV